jgi:hypothetical protein
MSYNSSNQFILAASRFREHNLECMIECLQHLEDDGIKGIERYCVGGCM